MFMHNKKLMYTVRVGEPNPALATLMLEQFGGPQGELAAAMRYFTQGLAESDPGRKDMLLDIATEELSHLEIIGSIICMLTKSTQGKLAEGDEEVAALYADITQGGESHTHAILYGGGPALVNSAGVPWTAAYIDTIGDPACDLRSNIAAESRAKIVYERLINVTDDPGIKDALGFLMTREIAHQKSFEKALYSMQPNFPPGKLPGMPDFTDVYFDMSQDGFDTAGEPADADALDRGPWNTGPEWTIVSDREAQAAVDGGDGTATVKLTAKEKKTAKNFATRTASDPGSDPTTGADLGAGPGAGATKKTRELVDADAE
ncbi:manganese catalase family protein [Roseiterribacter gracilis]|uniref:Mn-containing catalase n=1 Tax=Roseiterribacter gracilis TaxID=2812848 RepID=A0A8S8X6M0_9PROT|nr:Mn-containing catalase [Rhodospirillales bacterium TMPK1]